MSFTGGLGTLGAVGKDMERFRIIMTITYLRWCFSKRNDR